MHREVEQVETDHVDGEVDLSKSFIVHAARHFREPVVQSGEEPGQAAADDRVMEMAHDPESTRNAVSSATEELNTPVTPPMMNRPSDPTAKSIGVVNRMDPPRRVRMYARTMIANGIEMSSVVMLNASRRLCEMPVMNMWWAHTVKLKMLAIAKHGMMIFFA